MHIYEEIRKGANNITNSDLALIKYCESSDPRGIDANALL